MRLLAALALLVPLVASRSLEPDSSSPHTAKVSYDGYHLYRIRAADQKEAEFLAKRFATYHTELTSRGFEVIIPPNEVRNFNELGLNARLLSDDIGSQIRDESKTPTYKRELHKIGELPDLSWYDSFHAYEDHLQYWDDLVAAFPNNSKKYNIGSSYENRTIYAFHFFGDKGIKGDKPIILWHSTVHAREWITTLVIEYWAWQLIDGYKSRDSDITKVLNYYDFWLVPFHNPDGFYYTQTTDRMWRKNRLPRSNTTCIGTDLNRNWKFEWGGEPGTGAASTDPCDDTFQGLGPGDTPENIVLSGLSDKLGASRKGIRSYIDLHSYGQKILTPPGWTCNTSQYPPTLPRMIEVAEGFANSVQGYDSRNETYQYGAGCDIEYYSAGNGRDHHYGVYGANHSWTLELDPVTSSQGDFVLPPENIWPVVQEQWAGVLWLLNDVWLN
ncbi:hypothetical protein M441DRAFT_63276 [Trichoderma asperellum CBS 433.97]|uniref:Peptidase M14 domain-containing protein n=1 Tax=Trichoderma asperellum (strain ATCC 204424 / CBS 433.97 / NBRC 101777) TaxID=1042311 RepID=A0A2T3ZMC7_TRIA4|nr:hypothetical protein M441DRAFT_63276 [Trichoderma asperellum CBS 433.97]PTB45958.1 hypothetical protein M441DRAFT_63276 [Trichoderma asperellum CBS 433.97]